MKYSDDWETEHLNGPTHDCDWKDVCGLEDILLTYFEEKFPVGLDHLKREIATAEWPSSGDYGVGQMFDIADKALAEYGMTIVQFQTEGDFYSFQIVPESTQFSTDLEMEMDFSRPDEFCDDEIDQV